MHNIKSIRDNFDEFKKKIQNRNINFDVEKLKNLDVKNRELIQKKETLETVSYTHLDAADEP